MFAPRSSKHQITRSVELIRKIGLKEGARVPVSEENGIRTVEAIETELDKIRAAIPQNLKKKDITLTVQDARQNYYKRVPIKSEVLIAKS